MMPRFAWRRLNTRLAFTKGRWASNIGRIYARMTRRSQLAASGLMQTARGRDLEELFPGFTQGVELCSLLSILAGGEEAAGWLGTTHQSVGQLSCLAAQRQCSRCTSTLLGADMTPRRANPWRGRG